VQQPRILLLDEPTAHLDLGNKSRVLRLLTRMQSQGMTVIFTTHDPEAAALAADHLVLIHEGKTLAAGSPSQVLTTTNLAAVYDVELQVKQVDGRPIVLLER
jgi:iron complex transport system ATP-binding protein